MNLREINNSRVQPYTDLVYDFIGYMEIEESLLENSTKNGIAFLILSCLNNIFKDKKSFDELRKYVFTETEVIDENYRLWYYVFFNNENDIADILGQSLNDKSKVFSDNKECANGDILLIKCYEFLSGVSDADWDINYAKYLKDVTDDGFYFN